MRWATASSRGSVAVAPPGFAPAEPDDADPVAREARGLLAVPPDDARLRVVCLAPVDLLAVQRLV